LREVAFPLAKGTRWTNDTSCTIEYPGGTYLEHTKETSTVLGATLVTVGSHTYDAWVISTRESDTLSNATRVDYDRSLPTPPPYRSTYEHRVTADFAPEVGLTLLSTDVGTGSNGAHTIIRTFENAFPS
jgi:hypothetical protein